MRRTKVNDANELDLSEVTPKDIRRFWDKVGNETPEGCWPWRGSTDENGYGQFSYKGQLVGAHRFAYAQSNGIVEGGKHTNRKCQLNGCVNPNHVVSKAPLETESEIATTT